MIDLVEAIKTSFQLGKKYTDAEAKGFHPIDRNLYKKYNRFRPNGAKPVFCYLPFTSLTFSFGGQVYVCGYNRDIKLGQYPDNSIDEIWNGTEANKLREHMFHNDLDYGCRHCKYFFEKKKFSNLRPLVFDKYYKATDAAYPQVFEFELSNECNLECQMCHGEVSSSIRKNRDKLPPLPMLYDDTFVQQLEKYIPTLKEAKFYGGEPFLIPIYYKIWDKVKEFNPKLDLFVITNGTHWNSKIEKVVNELNFDVAVSIDAFDKEKVERIRKNVVYEKLLDNITRFSEICNRKGKHFSLSFTVQKDNWEQLPLIINLCNEVNAFTYVSYLERPQHFSIADLSKDELKKVRAYMEPFSFPKRTQKERHNANCFEDFKHYLDTYIENADVKKYRDYEFHQSAFHLPEQGVEEKDELKLIPVSANDFAGWVAEQYVSNQTFTAILPQETFMQKANTVLFSFSEKEKEVVRGFMRQSDFRQLAADVESRSVEELKQLSTASLSKYYEQAAKVE